MNLMLGVCAHGRTQPVGGEEDETGHGGVTAPKGFTAVSASTAKAGKDGNQPSNEQDAGGAGEEKDLALIVPVRRRPRIRTG